jgi:hypothetical protein
MSKSLTGRSTTSPSMARTGTDISSLLCDACLFRLEQWLKEGTGEVPPGEFLRDLLEFGHTGFDRFFCGRCASKLESMKS